MTTIRSLLHDNHRHGSAESRIFSNECQIVANERQKESYINDLETRKSILDGHRIGIANLARTRD